MKTYEKSRKLDIVQKNIARIILLNETWRFEIPLLFAFENVVVYKTGILHLFHFVVLILRFYILHLKHHNLNIYYSILIEFCYRFLSLMTPVVSFSSAHFKLPKYRVSPCFSLIVPSIITVWSLLKRPQKNAFLPYWFSRILKFWLNFDRFTKKGK